MTLEVGRPARQWGGGTLTGGQHPCAWGGYPQQPSRGRVGLATGSPHRWSPCAKAACRGDSVQWEPYLWTIAVGGRPTCEGAARPTALRGSSEHRG